MDLGDIEGNISNLKRNLDSGDLFDSGIVERKVPGIPPGAMPLPRSAPTVSVKSINGLKLGQDTRVRIIVPREYLVPQTLGSDLGELKKIGGIIFPYTPTINYELKADYTSQTPLHSNFAINFYSRSSVSQISISGKFSVENADEAAVYLSTNHLLKSLTRMRSGGITTGDANSGSPPPICRLFAHGDAMLNNVPVAITSYRIDLPDGVDYFTVRDDPFLGTNSVPTVSTIAVTCMPMYSRDEMQRFSVTGYLADESYRERGFI